MHFIWISPRHVDLIVVQFYICDIQFQFVIGSCTGRRLPSLILIWFALVFSDNFYVLGAFGIVGFVHLLHYLSGFLSTLDQSGAVSAAKGLLLEQLGSAIVLARKSFPVGGFLGFVTFWRNIIQRTNS